MPSMQPSPDEVQDLRRCVRDLVALSTLFTVWGNADPPGVGRSLAEVLLRILGVDFVYVYLNGRADGPAHEAVRTRDRAEPEGRARAIGRVLAPWLNPDGAEEPRSIPNPVGQGALRLVVFPIGYKHDHGLLAAGCGRPDFPTDTERLLLRVAVNQTAALLRRQEVETELRRQSDWLRVTLAGIGDAVISTDGTGRVTLLNAVAEAMTGWPQAEAQGRPLPEVFHIVNEHTREPAENPALRALREGRIVELANHTVLIGRDGTERLIDDSAAPIRGEADGRTGAVLVFRDVTERRAAERALQRKEAELRDFLENATVALARVGPDGTILWANQAELELLGYDREEYLGRNVAEFHTDPAIIEDILRRVLSREEIPGREARLRRKDGAIRHVVIHMNGLWDGERLLYLRCFSHDITDRKRAEEAHARLAAIVESSDDAIVSKTLDGVITSWNQGAERIFGYTAAEAVGQPITLIIPPERLGEEPAILERLRRGERVDHFETVRVARDGRLLDISLTISPVRDGMGRIIGASKIARDITERKRAEAAVREREERLQLFLGNATDYAVILSDLDDRITEWLGGAEQITGWRADEAIGRPVALIFTPEDRVSGVPEHETTRAAEAGRSENARWHIRKDGSRFYGDGVTVSVRGPDGDLRGFGKVFRDATAEKLAQDAVARDALLLASVRDSVVVTDLDGVVTYWNEGATRLYGWTAEEMVGRPYADRFPEPARTFIADQIQERAAGLEWNGEFEDFRKDGSRVWIDARVGPVRDAEGRVAGILGVSHDITERKRAEDALREADRRKDEFLALLAHELRNPLAPLRNGLQVMKLAAHDPKAVGQSRGMMERQLGHMVRLIDDLLDVSRITRNKMELRRARVLLADVINAAVETARPAIEQAEHDLIVSLPPEPVFLDADLTRLAQVFANLLSNSAKYTPHGGQIRLAAHRKGTEVVISVRDNGIGIPAESLGSIFDMFSQVDRSIERATGGLGIGLALVKGLVEMHGGTVSTESPGPGQGSTFRVRLPVLEVPAESAPESPSDRSRGSFGPRRRILVVDDNRDSAASMALMLEFLGNDVRMVHDGIEAVEAAASFRPQVILMDVGMPRLNGMEATRRIRQQPWGQATAIIALTGWGQQGDRARSLEAGCDGHLVKPVSLPELEELLGTLEQARRR